ncbi:aspartyl/asparaginyl beta-hydroxylase domain-containing protein [Thalassomonas haliotis]|uniref:Aspartyl/asparaginyl beta-hydroxylase domain-containing protein n=1 Tax=Thalassomonas haliotis TaxID=485448 RepID=A0ABY7VCE0_9GAMM|nr:aspartyl/asparaginyl beta-hydroxylase domain-containing protein [Thalassomonas haliotis]WDE11299.1 aspartyl/asparaginyl beta-hydroxylase domain-containing protein [Thalassomonas haliotis]
MSELLRLKLNFNVSALQRELANFQQPHWQQHFNTSVNEFGWSALPLRSPGGRIDSVLAGEATAGSYADTPYLTLSPYLQQVLESFHCPKHAVRLLALAPGAQIKRHRDHELSFEDGLARIHIPVRSHHLVEFMINDQRLNAGEGEAWYINANYPHSVNNASGITRVHLVIDCQVNSWLKNEFTQAGYRKKQRVNKYGDASINDDNVLEVIARLKTLNTPGGDAMAQRLSEIINK